MQDKTRKEIIKLHNNGVTVSEMRKVSEALKTIPEKAIHDVLRDYKRVAKANGEVDKLKSELKAATDEVEILRNRLDREIKIGSDFKESLDRLTAERSKWLRKIKRLEANK